MMAGRVDAELGGAQVAAVPSRGPMPASAPIPGAAKTPWWRSGRAISWYWVLAFLILGQFATSSGLIDKIFLASPWAIAGVADDMFFGSGDFYPHFAASLKEATLGFARSIVVGILFGLPSDRFEGGGRAAGP